MNTQEREQIGRLIRRFAAKAATDDLLVLIAETDGLLEACKHLLAEAKDPVTAAWLQSECEAAKTRPNLFLAEIEAILTIIKPSQEHADLFALLELAPGAGCEAIKRNYRRLSRRYHPDTGGSKHDEDTFIRITQAYQRLLASADSTPGELPTPRRENSHWRNSVVASTSELRRAQKRRNVVVVALLSLTLIFVSLLAGRTYNSRVMMSGLKNKGVAFVPPTATQGKPAPATADTPQPSALTATNTPAATPTSNEQAATTGPIPPTTLHEQPAAPANPPTREPQPTELTVAATTETAPATAQPIPAAAEAEAPRQALTATEPPAEAPTTQLTPTNRKRPVAKYGEQSAAAQASESPATAPTQLASTTPTDSDPSQGGRAPHTTSVLANAPALTAAPPTAPPAPKQTPAAATTPATPNTQLASTTPTDCDPSQLGCAPRTTNLPAPATETASVPPNKPTPAKATTQLPTEHQTRQRLETFLRNYIAAYEQKNLHTFAQFFALDAKENGKSLTEVLPAYADLFAAAETLRFTIAPDHWQREQNGLNLSGRFSITMDLHDGTRREGQGTIDFRLTDTTPPQVQTLHYTFDQ